MSQRTEALGRRGQPGPAGAHGMAAGTWVMTAEGAIPVEFLDPGERIVTRSGMRILRDIRRSLHFGRAIKIAGCALRQDGPGHDLILLEDTMVFMPGTGGPAAAGAGNLTPLGSLLDDRYVFQVDVLAMPMFRLCLDEEEIVFLDGVGVLCPAVSGFLTSLH